MRGIVLVGCRVLFLLPVALLAASQVAPVAGQPIGKSGAVCQGGSASGYPCSNVDLLSFVPVGELSVSGTSDDVNDVWGWTDPVTGREYAIVGLFSGTAFVDVTDPVKPVVVAKLPATDGRGSLWRDMKVYGSHAYVVSEATNHGMQVFDLTELRSIVNPPQEVAAVATYTGPEPGSFDAHNLAINEETGYAYIVGANGTGIVGCTLGLHIVDVRIPASPVFAGCFLHTGTGSGGRAYSHHTQCVNYHGPDEDYDRREICFSQNETHLSIGDVTDKDNTVPIARADYSDLGLITGYVHSGWLTEDHRYLYQSDEFDESSGYVPFTSTMIWDLQDLDEPVLVGRYESPTTAIDHDLYISGDLMYQANYVSGLRIIDISTRTAPVEVGYFDTDPQRSGPTFGGLWGVYPFFESGTIVGSNHTAGDPMFGGHTGLFVLKAGPAIVGVDAPLAATSTWASDPWPNPFDDRLSLTLKVAQSADVTISLFDMLGRRVANQESVVSGGGTSQRFDLTLEEGLAAGVYVLRVRGLGIDVSRSVVRTR